jgi:hypothetical protein
LVRIWALFGSDLGWVSLFLMESCCFSGGCGGRRRSRGFDVVLVLVVSFFVGVKVVAGGLGAAVVVGDLGAAVVILEDVRQ